MRWKLYIPDHDKTQCWSKIRRFRAEQGERELSEKFDAKVKISDVRDSEKKKPKKNSDMKTENAKKKDSDGRKSDDESKGGNPANRTPCGCRTRKIDLGL